VNGSDDRGDNGNTDSGGVGGVSDGDGANGGDDGDEKISSSFLKKKDVDKEKKIVNHVKY